MSSLLPLLPDLHLKRTSHVTNRIVQMRNPFMVLFTVLIPTKLISGYATIRMTHDVLLNYYYFFFLDKGVT